MLAVFFGISAALCWSLHDLLVRINAARIGAFRMAAYVMVAGGILLSFYILYDGKIWSASWRGIGDGFLLGPSVVDRVAPTMRLARSVDRRPTSARSETTAC